MSVNMSLAEIISANKKLKSGSSGKFRSNQKKTFGGKNAPAKRPSKNFSFSNSIPEGKWKHDKYEENVAPVLKSIRGSVGNPNKKVTVNISNLAPSVVSADLEELFEIYDFDSVAVHFNEHGESLGSGSVVVKRGDAQKILEDFKGVNLDGLAMKMTIVDDGSSNRQSIKDRLQFTRPQSGRIQKTRAVAKNSGKIQKNKNKTANKHFLDRVLDDGKSIRGKKGVKEGKRAKVVKVSKKSIEQLDAEIEEYMQKKNI